MNATKYRTIADAINAVCLDYGYNPFPVVAGGRTWRKASRQALAAMGYEVMTARERAAHDKEQSDVRAMRIRDHQCVDCGCKVGLEWMYDSYKYPEKCGDCRTYSFVCDRGHRWQATNAQDEANGHKCPTCGEYWV